MFHLADSGLWLICCFILLSWRVSLRDYGRPLFFAIASGPMVLSSNEHQSNSKRNHLPKKRKISPYHIYKSPMSLRKFKSAARGHILLGTIDFLVFTASRWHRCGERWRQVRGATWYNECSCGQCGPKPWFQRICCMHVCITCSLYYSYLSGYIGYTMGVPVVTMWAAGRCMPAMAITRRMLASADGSHWK